MKKGLFFKKPVDILLSIRDGNIISKVANKVGTTYAHTNHICHKFEEEGIITLEPKGRSSVIRLTEKGRILQNYLRKMVGVLKNV